MFFKFTPEISQSNIKTSIQGVVTGDGIASNRLECVSCEAYMQKNALNMFRKSLFCIENQKKYTYQKSFLVCRDKKEEVFKSKDKLQEEEYEKSLKFWKNKAKDEKDANIRITSQNINRIGVVKELRRLSPLNLQIQVSPRRRMV